MLQRLIKQILSRTQKTKNIAKSRLQLILIQDRMSVNEEVMEKLQVELTELLSKYFELKSNDVEVGLQRENDSVALVANIPVFGMKTRHPVQCDSVATV
jgi:cell division topological specificity factor